MTGQELYELCRARFTTWSFWESLSPASQQKFEAIAGILNERQAERIAAEIAGEDI